MTVIFCIGTIFTFGFQDRVGFWVILRTPEFSSTLEAVGIVNGSFEIKEKTENEKHEDKRTVTICHKAQTFVQTLLYLIGFRHFHLTVLNVFKQQY